MWDVPKIGRGTSRPVRRCISCAGKGLAASRCQVKWLTRGAHSRKFITTTADVKGARPLDLVNGDFTQPTSEPGAGRVTR